jgi:hypothetical protein
MDEKHQCPFCKQYFSRLQRLESHLKRKTPCHVPNELTKKITIGYKDLKLEPDVIFCQYCKKKFTRKDNLTKHIKNSRCEGLRLTSESSISISNLERKMILMEKQIAELKEKPLILEKQIAELKEKPLILEKQIAELKEKPGNVINNNLQIVCIGNNDNYLDMLTHEWQNFDRALQYIADCALSNVLGDCKLIEKIYLIEDPPRSEVSIHYIDKNRTKIEYFNEKKEKVLDSKELFGRKISNNLQNSYLKGVNHLINKNLGNRLCPNKFLEEYDLQIWNQHIYDLSDHKYQRKMVNQLNIPLKMSQ